jgi:AraC-like DNA-binding protein
MQNVNADSKAPAARNFDPRHISPSPPRLVAEENDWRVLPEDRPAPASRSRIRITRWHTSENSTKEFAATTPADHHVVKVVLRSANIRLAVAGRTIQDGIVAPGMFHITEPTLPVCCRFRGSYDTLHLHVPNDLIAECADSLPGHTPPALGPAPALAKDPVVESLVRVLLDANEPHGEPGALYADYISIAVVARLLHSVRQSSLQDKPKVAELARWRLKRALDYIEVGLEKTISLADIAAASGLSRMHFAAQFRAATGLRPHEYLLRRRIERAQEMLTGTDATVVDIALSVGFQTQSHFTTIFKRFVGQPPHAWRRGHAMRPANTDLAPRSYRLARPRM